MVLRDESALSEMETGVLAAHLARVLAPDGPPGTEPETIREDASSDHLLGHPVETWLVAGGVLVIVGAVGVFALGGAGVLAGVVASATCLFLMPDPAGAGDEGDGDPDEAPGRDAAPGRRITALGRVDLVFRRLGSEEGELLLGPEPFAEEVQLEVPRLTRASDLPRLLEQVDEILSEAPKVLRGGRRSVRAPGRRRATVLHGREEELHAALGELRELAEAREVESVTLRAVPPAAPVREMLEEHPAPGEAKGGEDHHPARDLLNRLGTSVGARERKLAEILERWDQKQDVLHALRLSSLSGGVAPLCHNLADAFHYSAFNLYCPACNEARIDELLDRDYSVQDGEDHEPIRYPPETRCRYEPGDAVWRCGSCDRKVDRPLPIHKALDEVFLPVYNGLMEEHKTERLRIYSGIRDQELDYVNQCRSEAEEVSRSGRELIEEMQTEIARVQAEIAGERQALSAFAEILDEYRSAQSDALRDIRESTRRIEQAVEEENERVRERMEEISRRSRERLTLMNRRLARAKKLEDQQRDEVLRQSLRRIDAVADAAEATAAHTGRIAEESARQTERLEEIKGNQKRQMHIQHAMAEESGVEIGASRFDPVGRFREKKAELVSGLTGEDDVRRAARKEDALS